MTMRVSQRPIAGLHTRWRLPALLASAAVCLALSGSTISFAAPPVDQAELLALCQDDSGEDEKRLAACTIIVDDTSADVDLRIEALLNRGTVREAAEDYDGALEDYSAVIGLNPASALAHFNRANVLGHLERPQDALKDYDKAIELDPKDGDFYVNRALVHSDLGDHLKAVEDLSRAIKMGLEEAAIYTARGQANEQLGRTDAAIADYRTALTLDDDDDDAKQGLDRLKDR